MLRRVTTTAALVVLAAGCAWPTAGYDVSRRAWSPDHTVTPANAKDLKLIWGPIQAGGEVVGTRDVIVTSGMFGTGGIVARDPATGVERWHADVTTPSVSAIDAGTVTTAGGGSRCRVQRFDLTTGAPLGSVPVGTEFTDAPLSTACATGRAVLVDAEHVVVTTASTVTRNSPSCDAASPPQQWGLTRTVSVLDHSLTPEWELADAQLGCGTPPSIQFGAPDLARVGSRYIVTRGNDVLGLPVECGTPCTPEWTHPYSGAPSAPMGLGTGDAFVQVVPGHPTVFDPATGAVRWSGTGPSDLFAAAATDQFLITPGTTVRAYPVDGCGAATCAPAWSVPLDTVIPSQPISIAGDVAFAGKWEQPGVVIDARGCGASVCAPVASAGSAYATRTTVIAGRVYISGLGGLVAYALPST